MGKEKKNMKIKQESGINKKQLKSLNKINNISAESWTQTQSKSSTGSEIPSKQASTSTQQLLKSHVQNTLLKKSSHKNLLTGNSSRQNRVQHALRSSFILLKQINTNQKNKNNVTGLHSRWLTTICLQGYRIVHYLPTGLQSSPLFAHKAIDSPLFAHKAIEQITFCSCTLENLCQFRIYILGAKLQNSSCFYE